MLTCLQRSVAGIMLAAMALGVAAQEADQELDLNAELRRLWEMSAADLAHRETELRTLVGENPSQSSGYRLLIECVRMRFMKQFEAAADQDEAAAREHFQEEMANATRQVRQVVERWRANVPDDSEALLALAGLQTTPEAAEAVLSQAIDEFPSDARVREQMAGLVASQGRGEEGLAMLDELVAAHPDDPRAHAALVGFCQMFADREQALARLDAWRARLPGDLEAARMYVGMRGAELGEKDGSGLADTLLAGGATPEEVLATCRSLYRRDFLSPALGCYIRLSEAVPDGDVEILRRAQGGYLATQARLGRWQEIDQFFEGIPAEHDRPARINIGNGLARRDHCDDALKLTEDVELFASNAPSSNQRFYDLRQRCSKPEAYEALFAEALLSAPMNDVRWLLRERSPEGMEWTEISRVLLHRLLVGPDRNLVYFPYLELMRNHEADLADQTTLLNLWCELQDAGQVTRRELVEALRVLPNGQISGTCSGEPREALDRIMKPYGVAYTVDPALMGNYRHSTPTTTWPEKLDAFCAVVGCGWELRPGEPPTIEIYAAPLRYETVSIESGSAPAPELLAKVAEQVGLSIEVDPRVSGRAWLGVEHMEWPTALDLLCLRAECTWYEEEGVIRVLSRNESEPASIELFAHQEPFRDVVQRFADLRGARLSIDDWFDPDHPINFDATGMAWSAALNALCKREGCGWNLRHDRLSISRRIAHPFPHFIPPVEMNVRFGDTEGEFAAARVRLALHQMAAMVQPIEDADAALALTWLPLGSELQVLIAVVVRCKGDGQRFEVLDVFEPIVRPFSGTYTSPNGRYSLELEEAPDRELPEALPPRWRSCRGFPSFIEAVLEVVDRTSDCASCQHVFSLSQATPRLVMSLDSGDRDNMRFLRIPGLAVVPLGPAGEYDQRVAVLYPDPGSGTMLWFELVLAPGGPQGLRLPLEDGTTVDLELTLQDRSFPRR